MPTMTPNDAKAVMTFLSIALLIWCVYGTNHGEDQYVSTINSFWLGAINFMMLFYIFFSK